MQNGFHNLLITSLLANQLTESRSCYLYSLSTESHSCYLYSLLSNNLSLYLLPTSQLSHAAAIISFSLSVCGCKIFSMVPYNHIPYISDLAYFSLYLTSIVKTVCRMVYIFSVTIKTRVIVSTWTQSAVAYRVGYLSTYRVTVPVVVLPCTCVSNWSQSQIYIFTLVSLIYRYGMLLLILWQLLLGPSTNSDLLIINSPIVESLQIWDWIRLCFNFKSCNLNFLGLMYVKPLSKLAHLSSCHYYYYFFY